MERKRDLVGGGGLSVSIAGICAALVLALAAPCAIGDVIYETEGPFGGLFGLWGYDVFIDQSVGLRFTPDADYTLDRISLWFMSNDFSGEYDEEVTVTLRDDNSSGGISIPGDTIYETWTFVVSAIGWNPVLELMDSVDHPPLDAGVNYWVVAESDASGGVDGVWNIAAHGLGFMANTDRGEWQPGGMSAVVCTIVEATPAEDLAGDLDGDCDVDLADLAILLAHYGTSSGAEPEDGDLDGDGDVDLGDLAGLLANYGMEC